MRADYGSYRDLRGPRRGAAAQPAMSPAFLLRDRRPPQPRRTAEAPPRPSRRGLAWPRLRPALELATIGAGYGAYSLVRLGLTAGRRAAFAHAEQLWGAESRLHLNIEPRLNHLAALHPLLADTAGYYYGLLHFIVTAVVLGWLFWRRPDSFPRLRSALVLATTAANVVFWTWPTAPPRLARPGMTDILAARHILGAADHHVVSRLADLYAAMPSLHVAWATWCAFAVVSVTRTRWRHLAWLYPLATTFVVLATANHFLLDTVAGAAIAGLGLLGTGHGRVIARRARRPYPAIPAAAAAVARPARDVPAEELPAGELLRR